MATYKESTSPGVHLRVGRQPLGGNENAANRTKVRLAIVDITFSNSYTTGGEAITASNLRFVNIHKMLVSPNGGYTFSVDYTDPTAPKVLAWRSGASGAAHTQAPNTTDLHTIVARALVYGTPT